MKSISSSTRLMGQSVGTLIVLVLGVSLQASYKTLDSRGELLVFFLDQEGEVEGVR
jgi:predicted permease